MKKNIFLFLAIIACLIASAQQVEFFEGTWQEANDLAATENKFIFVDAYTEWCGWCKVMDKEMFTDPEVAPFINENFIPVKIDFEDSLGVLLSMKFRVSGFPTTLVFNSYGQMVDQFSGYTYTHSDYLDFLKKCLEIKEERVFSYDSRDLDLPYPEFYLLSFKKGKERKWPSDSLVTSYLKTQDDLFSEVNWSVLVKFNPNGYDEFVLNNLDEYKKRYGKFEANDYVSDAIYSILWKAIDSTDLAKLRQALDLCDKLEEPESYKLSIQMTYYQETKDWQKFAEMLESYISIKGYENHMMINNNCWAIYENVEDKEILQKAVEWMKVVIEQQPIWMYLDTYAALLYKSGNLDEALKYSDIAIDTGEKAGEKDVSTTKELKEKIEKAMKE
jgi:thioredoxin-related protein